MTQKRYTEIPKRQKCVNKEEPYIGGAVDIIDDELGKPQSQVNEETNQRVITLEENVGTGSVDQKINAEKKRAEGVEATHAQQIADLQAMEQIVIDGGEAQIATGADFTNPDATKRAKVPTVGAVLDGMNDGVYDVSKRNPTGGENSDGKFTLAYILANAGTLIPTSWRHGGMSISFVSSADNKYVQYRLTSDTFTTTESEWKKQGAEVIGEIVLRSLINPDECEIGRINADGTITITGGTWRLLKVYLKAGTYWLKCPRTWGGRPTMYQYSDSTYSTPTNEIVPSRGAYIDERISVNDGYYAISYDSDAVTDDTAFLVNCNIIDDAPIDGSSHLISSGAFKEIKKNGIYDRSSISELSVLTKTTSIDNAFIGPTGSQVSNNDFRIDKYSVSGGNIYLFDGYFSSGVTINFIAWFNGSSFIGASEQKGASSQYTRFKNEPIIAPDNATYAYLNIQKSVDESKLQLVGDRVSITEATRTRGYLSSCDLDTIQSNGIWMLLSSNEYDNLPDGIDSGVLRVSIAYSGRFVMQEVFAFRGAGYFKRVLWVDEWEDWIRLDGQIITNNYEFNEYQQTVNLTASPTITTDTNNYLASTNDTTDRTSSILAMLQATGMCHLGVGDFYIDGLVMPADSQIVGCGTATKVHLIAGNNKFAISMKSRCSVKDLLLIGASSHTPTSTIGTRHAILWEGNYTSSQSSASQPDYGIIDNVYIWNFNGSGIKCYDTGYGTYNFISVTNCNIRRCDIGVNIEYWSEYHKFTNVCCNVCWYGCINNGGNNIFTNCDFSDNFGIGFLMDNSQSQSPNNSHGSCVGCVFNHTSNNEGLGIKVLNCTNGFIFTGCQIFYSQILFEDSDGMVVSSCNFGKNNCNITIDGGNMILFANNIHQDTPTITITDNTKVQFVNCYNRSTGALIGQ